MKGRTKSQEWRLKLSVALKGRRHSQERVAAIIAGLTESRRLPKAMNNPERRIMDVLGSMYGQHNPYTFTGDRRFWIQTASRQRNPDFTAVSERQIIEVFGRYWHRDDDPLSVVKEYERVGWSCLVLWEDEIGADVIDRIHAFTFPAEYEFELWQLNRIA